MRRNTYIIGLDGRPLHEGFVNWNGQRVSEYDEHIIWKSPDFNPDTDSAIYSDRMWQNDGERYYAAVRTLWPESPQRQLFHDITKEQADLLLTLYLGHDIKLTAILTGKNAHNGYPYWVFGYRTIEKPRKVNITMRTIVNNSLLYKPVVEVPKTWQFDTYRDASESVKTLVENTLASLRKNLVGKFSTENDDVVNLINQHEASIFYNDIVDPLATFDIFGVAEFTDIYGGSHWYYRGFHMYRKANGKNIYCGCDNPDGVIWRSKLNAILTLIDEQLLKQQIAEM